jgi:cystathionine beta-lyase
MPLSLSTLAIHGDDEHNNIPDQIAYGIQDVAPALHVSTTFRYSNNPDHLVEARYYDVCGRLFEWARR